MKTKIYINPPPADKKCERCHRHINDLKPFGKAGDPLVGDFEGQLLLKTFRGMTEPVEEFDKLLEDFIIDEHIEKKLAKKFGKDKAISLLTYLELESMVSPSWECRDCIIL